MSSYILAWYFNFILDAGYAKVPDISPAYYDKASCESAKKVMETFYDKDIVVSECYEVKIPTK